MLTNPEMDNLARGFMPARVLLSAVELDLFGHLGEESLTARSLAAKLGTDPRATEILADALTALDLLKKEEDLYRNTPTSFKYLASQSPRFRGGGLRHMANLWKSWSRLTEVVRTGGPGPAPWKDEDRTAFIQAMEHHAKGVAEKMAQDLDLAWARSLLDLGGGPGSFAIALVKANPQLSATVLDLPYALAIAKSAVEEAGLEERVTLKEGDFFTADLGQGYDLILISSIIHSLDEAENRLLLKRAREALRPGGMIAIRDFLVDTTRTQPQQAALFAVNMLVNTRGGRTYHFEEISGWLKELGFLEIEESNLDGRSQIVLAKKPA